MANNPRRRRLEMPLQADWYQDPKFVRIVREFGWEGAAYALVIAGLLWREPDCRMKLADLDEIAWTNHQNPAVLKSVISKTHGLFEIDGEYFSCPYVTREAAAMDERLNTWRENGRKGGRPRKETESPTKSTQQKPMGFENETKPKPVGLEKKPNHNQAQSNLLISNQSDQINSDQEGESEGEQAERDSARAAVAALSELPADEPVLSEDERGAEKFLCQPTGSEPWETDPRYVNAGQRPMRKYPLLFLTRQQLIKIVHQFSGDGIPPGEFYRVFQRVNAKLEKKQASRESTAHIDAFSWLIGWAKAETLKELADVSRLERERIYTARATE